MEVNRFEGSPVGHLVPITVEDQRFGETFHHHAYVPEPLPRDLDLSSQTWQTVNEAATALGRLDTATTRLPNPLLLVRPAIRKEAVSTSALEGTYTELEEVLESELLGDEDRNTDIREVRNFVVAAERAIELVEERPLATNLICELHAILMDGTRGSSWQNGAVRGTHVWIGPGDAPVTESRFVPPPPGDTLLDGLKEWERWAHGETTDLPLLVRIALAHYQFETIHPFHDGNGRLGRLISMLQLIEARVLKHPVLYISPWFETRREAYHEWLRRVSETGDFDGWVSFFSQAVRDQAADAVDRTEKLLALRDSMISALRQAGARGVALDIAEHLIGFPVTSPTDASSNHGVSYQAANQAISKLTDLGILQEMTGKRYARVFAAPEVLQVIR